MGVEVVDTLLVTAAEMRAIEAEEAKRGNTGEILMERAGRQVAGLARQSLPRDSMRRVLVVAGPGNNGGDGLVVARLLAAEGAQVRCWALRRDPGTDRRLQDPLGPLGVVVRPLSEAVIASLRDDLKWCDTVIDALFGTGLEREITGTAAGVVEAINASRRAVVAVDIPSGVDSDRGTVHGTAVRATVTVALSTLKYGHVIEPGSTLSGKIVLGDIGVSEQISRTTASGQLLTEDYIQSILPERAADANKGTFGKAMVVAGSINYIGAAALATQGAMRSGAGLVTLGCAVDLLPILATKLLECTYLPLPSDMGAISERAVERLRGELGDYKALLVGSGLGKDKETVAFMKSLLSEAENSQERHIGFTSFSRKAEDKHDAGGPLPPLVLDGDALNIISEWDDWASLVPEGSVLTPHPGEMARLLKSSIDDVQADRVGVAKKAAANWKTVVVLKGAATVIATPKGKVFVSPFLNPALATAGSGDVLAGAIAGFVAQGLAPADAACAGVFLHGLAGDLLRAEYGPAGGLAGELPVLLAKAQGRVRGAKEG